MVPIELTKLFVPPKQGILGLRNVIQVMLPICLSFSVCNGVRYNDLCDPALLLTSIKTLRALNPSL